MKNLHKNKKATTFVSLSMCPHATSCDSESAPVSYRGFAF